MPRILLTRPWDDSEALAADLVELGYDVTIEPLLAIAPVQRQPPDLENLQAIVVTSRHAFDFVDRKLCEKFFERPCFCVGAATVTAARTFGFLNAQSADGDGKALVKLIMKACKAEAGALLHMAGLETNSDWVTKLTQENYTIRTWVLYEAVAAQELTEPTIALFRNKEIIALPVFSARTAVTLKNLIHYHRLEECCRNVIALGISDAVCKELQSLPWLDLKAAPHPTEKDIFHTLQKLVPSTAP